MKKNMVHNFVVGSLGRSFRPVALFPVLTPYKPLYYKFKPVVYVDLKEVAK